MPQRSRFQIRSLVGRHAYPVDALTSSLGLFPLLICPHLDGEKRGASFRAMVAQHGDVGIGLDNFAALEIVDGQFRILSETSTAGGYKVYREGNKVVTKVLDRGVRFKPLGMLTGKKRRQW